MQNEKIKVLNISGWGRSGSTLLGNILGQCEGFFYGGELRNIWIMSLVRERLCGCNKKVIDCDVWKEIFNIAFGGMDKINAKDISFKIQQTTRTRYAFIESLPGGKKYYSQKASLCIEEIKKLMTAIKEYSNCKVIVDTTKSSLYSHLLSKIEDLDIYVIHLVRDPRGITYSWQKKVVQPDQDNTIYMGQYSPFRSSFMWSTRNLLTEYFWKKNKDKYLRIRYEDFAEEPLAITNQILDFIGEPSSKTPFISEKEIELHTNHSVWGNPGRFKTGKITLKLDEEWKRKLKTTDKLISTTATLPLLIKYGYKVNA